MPKKATHNRVEKAASSSGQAAKDVAALHEAVRSDSLTPEEKVMYQIMRPAFASSEDERARTRRPKKETAIPSESFEPVEDGNDSQFAAPTTN